MSKTFSQRSIKAMAGVHPDLVKVAYRALELCNTDFTVIEGVRTVEKQREYLAKGASRTMKSYHLVHEDGYGHALDIYPYYDGSVQCEAPYAKFKEISEAMKAAATELGVRITWGGDWKSFQDTPHYQIEV